MDERWVPRGATATGDVTGTQMTTAERTLYVQEFRDRIAAEVEHQPLTLARPAELNRRLEDYRAHPKTSIPWEQVRIGK